jgi:hypothetical protein
MIFLNTSACGGECEPRSGHQLGYGLSSIGDLFRRFPLGLDGSSLFGVGRNVLCGQLQIELSGEQVDHRLEVSD